MYHFFSLNESYRLNISTILLPWGNAAYGYDLLYLTEFRSNGVVALTFSFGGIVLVPRLKVVENCFTF